MSNSCVGRFSQHFISQTRLHLRVNEFSVNYVLLISSWKITSFVQTSLHCRRFYCLSVNGE